ncbi:MFS transporter [Asticcacaulis sp. SL142]|uniref:MFS transporter n=1 Tax=Asticcacaulis sp. SL142 TaxID=2995155 RepID=UPI00226CFFCC|nr:MFS transporter [Asticcacaulis sp. SL142]WAC48267.1 MFS transporter [Asticcacaulis sp. SL142]
MSTFAKSSKSMAAGASDWLSIAVVYVITFLSMASVTCVVPLLGDIQSYSGATPTALGFSLALFSAPSAILATFGGGAIDRFGARPSLIVSALVALLADPVAYLMPGALGLNVAMVLAGLGFAGISIAAPALIMTTVQGTKCVRAMSVWSTYPCAGYAVGLITGGQLAGTDNWRLTFVAHGVMLVLALLCTPFIAKPTIKGLEAKTTEPSLWSAVRNVKVLRLAIGAGLVAAVAYGTGLVATDALTRLHAIPISRATAILAAANVLSVVGGIAAGILMTRRVPTAYLFMGIVGLCIAAQFLLFQPAMPLGLALFALAGWMGLKGMAIAISMALLPQVVSERVGSGAAAGIVGQVISLMAFAVPPIYFAALERQGWNEYIIYACVGLLVSLLVLPLWRRPSMPSAHSALGAGLE